VPQDRRLWGIWMFDLSVEYEPAHMAVFLARAGGLRHAPPGGLAEFTLAELGTARASAG